MKIILLFIFFALSTGYSFWGQEEENAARKELRQILEKTEKLRDLLHDETALRWDKKQLYIQKREEDKQVLQAYEKDIERLYQEQARIKEEIFSRERMIEDENNILAQKKSDWQNVQDALGSELKNHSDVILQMFPLDMEDSRKQLKQIHSQYQIKVQFLPTLENYVQFRTHFINKGSELGIDKSSLSPDGKSVEQMTLARFGSVFAYGKTAEDQNYTIRQTGRLGAGRFQTELIGNKDLISELDKSFPKWISEGKPSGEVTVDVLQNFQSRVLSSGGEKTTTSAFAEFVRAGGMTMYPLMALPIWALVLIVLKIMQFLKRQSNDIKAGLQVVEKLEEGDNETARTLGIQSNSLVSDVMKVCTPESSREDVENKIEGILVKDEPVLNKYVNTIAVIAGVAPLLGLLGTVTGMINLFEAITQYGTGDPQLMAGGISEALVTTQMGLMIAIPLLLVHNYLKNWRIRIQSDLEKNSIDIINYLYPKNS